MAKRTAKADDVAGRAQRVFRRKEDTLGLLFERSADPMLLLDGGVFVDCNNAALDLLHCSDKNQLIGLHPFDMSPSRQPDGRLSSEKAQELIERACREGVNRFEWVHRDCGGGDVWIDVSLTVIPIRGRDILYVIWKDITGRKKEEEALYASRLQLSEAMELAHIVYWEFDPIAERLIFNDPFYAFYGTTAEQEGGYAMTRDDYAKRFIHPDDIPLYYQFLKENSSRQDPETVADREHRIVRRDGEVRHILARVRVVRDDSGHVIRRSGANQDITGRRRMEETIRESEEQLRQAQKMEAIGTLAGGIAHDLNNVLAAIMGNAELAIDDIPEESPAIGNMKQIEKATMRGRDLVRGILTFSRRTEKEQKLMHLAPLVEETFGFLRSSLPATVRMNLTIDTADDTVTADPSQIQQVVMNLAMNAAQAMPAGGLLTVSLSQTEFTQAPPVPDLLPGTYLVLTVSDTGVGVDRSICERIFEPFFTTKEQGMGTGLGLSVVYGIVKSHQGAVTVDSTPGKGCTFRVFLPRAQAADEAEQPEDEETPGGAEHILFVDDEDMIAGAGEAMLSRLGYRITTSTDPERAYKLFSEKPEAFDLVITDQTMPKLTGMDLAQKLLKVRPDLSVVLLTGYSDSVNEESARSAGIREFLLKPLSRRELAQAVRRALIPKV